MKTKTLEEVLAEWENVINSIPDEYKATKRAARIEKKALAVRARYEADMRAVVAELRQGLSIGDWLVEAWLNRKADTVPELVEWWEHRECCPDHFVMVLEELKPLFMDFLNRSGFLPKRPSQTRPHLYVVK